MSAISTHRSARTAFVAVVATAFLAGVSGMGLSGGTVAAGADDGGTTVVIETTGDQSNTITLPPAAVVGHTATTRTTIDVAATIAGESVEVSVQLDLSTVVSELTADGGYVSTATIDSIEVIKAPPGLDVASLGYDDLAGVKFEQTVDASGRVTSTELVDADQLTPEAQSAAAEFTGNLQAAQIAYPSEAVGVGAKWTAALEITSAEMTIPVTYHFEVTDITEGRYSLTISYDTDFDTDVEGSTATGTVSGAGTVTGSVDNVLDVSVSVDQTIDASVAAGGENIDMTVVIGVDMEAAVAAG